MHKVDGIGGVFFKARDPEALKKWYETTLGVDIQAHFWRQAAGPTVVGIFRDDTDYFGKPEQRWMINFRVSDLDTMIRQLEAAGIAVETRAEWDSADGRFARIHDPEGNPIELWEPGPAAR